MWEQNALRVLRNFIICCVAYKWVGGKTEVKALCDYKGYKPKFNISDRHLIDEIWHLLDQADIVVAHNGKQFDIKKINARFAVHGLAEPAPYKIVDTKVAAKSIFGFDSNKLNEIGRQLGLGEKEKTGGYDLWVGCMDGDPEAWSQMKKYNKRDVDLLEDVYEVLRPYMHNHPNMAMYSEKLGVCSKCGQTKGFHKSGMYTNKTTQYRVWRCKNCRGCVRTTLNLRESKPLVSF